MTDIRTKPERGILADVEDHGTILMFVVHDTDGHVQRLAADGNMARTAIAESGIGRGSFIEFDVTDWGGLAWFRPIEEGAEDAC